MPVCSITSPTLWLELAAEHLHERGFAAAVGADQAVAVAIGELDGDVFEERLGAELDGDVGSGEHSRIPIDQHDGPENPAARAAPPPPGRSRTGEPRGLPQEQRRCPRPVFHRRGRKLGVSGTRNRARRGRKIPRLHRWRWLNSDARGKWPCGQYAWPLTSRNVVRYARTSRKHSRVAIIRSAYRNTVTERATVQHSLPVALAKLRMVNL